MKKKPIIVQCQECGNNIDVSKVFASIGGRSKSAAKTSANREKARKYWEKVRAKELPPRAPRSKSA